MCTVLFKKYYLQYIDITIFKVFYNVFKFTDNVSYSTGETLKTVYLCGTELRTYVLP